MANPVTPFGEALRKLDLSMASVRANVDTLLDRLGIVGVTDEEIDRELAESPATTDNGLGGRLAADPGWR